MKTTWILHCHHDVLLEPLQGTLKERISYIKKEKPAHEQKTRLRLIKVLTEDEVELIPKKAWEAWYKVKEAQEVYSKAWKAWKSYDKAHEEYDKAQEMCDKAQEMYDKAQEVFNKVLLSPDFLDWHKKICVPGCPWDGSSIFPIV